MLLWQSPNEVVELLIWFFFQQATDTEILQSLVGLGTGWERALETCQPVCPLQLHGRRCLTLSTEEYVGYLEAELWFALHPFLHVRKSFLEDFEMPLCCVVLVIFVMFLHTEKCLWKNKDQIIFTIPVLYWINHFLHGIAAWGNATILNQGMWTPRGTLCGCAGYIWKLSCNFSGYKSNSTRFVWMNYENRANKSSSPLFLFTFVKK